MNRRGFSLIELLIVIGIAGILSAIAIPQYNQTMIRRNMEKQIREIQSDISSFRLSAIHRKEQHRILIGPRLLHFQRFNTNLAVPAWEPVLGAVPPPASGVPPARVLTYEIQRLVGGVLAPYDINVQRIEFDERGFADEFRLTTIVVVPVDISIGDSCIVVDRARNNIGRMVNANNCQVR